MVVLGSKKGGQPFGGWRGVRLPAMEEEVVVFGSKCEDEKNFWNSSIMSSKMRHFGGGVWEGTMTLLFSSRPSNYKMCFRTKYRNIKFSFPRNSNRKFIGI